MNSFSLFLGELLRINYETRVAQTEEKEERQCLLCSSLSVVVLLFDKK